MGDINKTAIVATKTFNLTIAAATVKHKPAEWYDNLTTITVPLQVNSAWLLDILKLVKEFADVFESDPDEMMSLFMSDLMFSGLIELIRESTNINLKELITEAKELRGNKDETSG